MLTHDDRERAEAFIQDARERAGMAYVLRYSVTADKWVSCSDREAAYYDRNHPGHLLAANRVPFRLEGDALDYRDVTLIVTHDQVMKPGEAPASGRAAGVYHRRASELGVLVDQAPDEMIVTNGPNGVEVYRRSLVLKSQAGRVARVTYKSTRAGSPMVVLEGDA